MIYLIVFFTSLVLTLFFTPALIDFITRIKVVDLPGERRVNKSAIPRMGGLIIYVVVLILVISFYGNLNSVRFFILASGLIALLGIVDDMVGVKWNHKFIIQFLMSFFLIYFLAGNFDVVNFFGIELVFPLNYLLMILLIVGVINSINMLDGLDGLVSGFSLLVLFVTFLVGYNTGNSLLLILSASLMGALIGFLKFNAFPAKIFLLCSYYIYSRHVIAQEIGAEVVAVIPCNAAAIFQLNLAKIGFVPERGGNPFTNKGMNVNHFAKPILKFDFK